MSHKLWRWQRFLLVFGALVLVLIAAVPAAEAQGLTPRDHVDSGEVLDQDVILNGDEVIMSGTVNGDVFATGGRIIISGIVNGSLFIVGENVSVLGNVKGSTYVTAVSLDLGSTAKIGRSLYFLGVSLITEKNSLIEQNLYGVSLGARLAGTVNGQSEVIVGLIELGKLVLDSINRVTTGIPIGEVFPSAAPARPLAQARELQVMAGALGPLAAQDGNQVEDSAQGSNVGDWALNRLRVLISLLIVGAFFLWLLPKQLEQWRTKVQKRPFAALGWGLVTYVMGFITTLIFLALFIAIGLSFIVVTLWGLAFIFWGLSLSALSLFFATFILFVSYGSKIIVAYLVGWLIFDRFYPRANKHRVWPLLLGLIIYLLLASIPYLGWAISLIVTFIGLGAVWMVFGDWQAARRIEPETAVE